MLRYCLIPPGLRTCVRCTRIRRKCSTRRASNLPTSSIRAHVATIRSQLLSTLSSLRTIDNDDDSDPIESSVSVNLDSGE